MKWNMFNPEIFIVKVKVLDKDNYKIEDWYLLKNNIQIEGGVFNSSLDMSYSKNISFWNKMSFYQANKFCDRLIKERVTGFKIEKI